VAPFFRQFGEAGAVKPNMDPVYLSFAIDRSRDDVVETEQIFRKESIEAPQDADRRVDTPVDKMRVGDKDIVPHPDVVISAPACCCVKLRGRVKPRPERPEGQDAALEQERLKPVEVQQGILRPDVLPDLVAVNGQTSHGYCDAKCGSNSRLL
jgi:hypothetical protein